MLSLAGRAEARSRLCCCAISRASSAADAACRDRPAGLMSLPRLRWCKNRDI
jgi:hypothetical protein